MPLYEYQCENCEKTQEIMQKFSDAPLTDCELCGGKGTLSKMISRSSFALKGSGWYVTDYKKSGQSKPKSE
jgi:putative FmdB family regulatory protein